VAEISQRNLFKNEKYISLINIELGFTYICYHCDCSDCCRSCSRSWELFREHGR